MNFSAGESNWLRSNATLHSPPVQQRIALVGQSVLSLDIGVLVVQFFQYRIRRSFVQSFADNQLVGAVLVACLFHTALPSSNEIGIIRTGHIARVTQNPTVKTHHSAHCFCALSFQSAPHYIV